MANKSTRVPALHDRARRVQFQTDNGLDSSLGHIEVMTGNGFMEIFVTRSTKGYDKKRWNTQTIYFQISTENWGHLMSAPIKFEPKGTKE